MSKRPLSPLLTFVALIFAGLWFILSYTFSQIYGNGLADQFDSAVGRLFGVSAQQVSAVLSPYIFPVGGAALCLWAAFQTAIWYLRHTEFSEDPQADISAHDAFRHLVVYSKWAKGRHDEDGLQPVGASLLEQADQLLRSAALQGRIRVWGRPKTESFLPQAEVRIADSYWHDAGFDLIACWQYPDRSPRTWSHKHGKNDEDIVYKDVLLNRYQLTHLWPRASWLGRHRDKWASDRDNPAFDIAEREGKKWRPGDT